MTETVVEDAVPNGENSTFSNFFGGEGKEPSNLNHFRKLARLPVRGRGRKVSSTKMEKYIGARETQQEDKRCQTI